MPETIIPIDKGVAPMKKFIFIALLFNLFASSAMSSEIVEPGETQVFTEIDDCAFTPFTDGNKATDALCTAPSRVEAAAALFISGNYWK